MLIYDATIYQTQDEQHSKNIENDRIELKKTRTRHILELKIGMEMEWKKMSEKKLRRCAIENGAHHLDGELNPR